MDVARWRSGWLVAWTAGLAVGSVGSASAKPPVENVCVPASNGAEWCGDGGPARRAGVIHPSSLDVLPDGTVVIFENGTASQGRFAIVRAVTPDGVIHRIAGTGQAGESDGGGRALNARVAADSTIAARPDGSFLIAEREGNRIRQVTPDGRIDTVAGTGARGTSGDGGPARAATLDRPLSVSTTPDGGYVVADADGRIRRIAPDGTISTFATVKPRSLGGFPLLTLTAVANGDIVVGNGKVVVELSPHGAARTLFTVPRRDDQDDWVAAVAQAADGRILVTTARGFLLRIEPNGQATRLAGTTGFRCHFPPDGAPAARLTLASPDDLAVAPDGGILVADWENHRVRRIGPDGAQSLFAGGTGSRSGGSCGFGAGETDMDYWQILRITAVRMSHSRVTIRVLSTLPGRVKLAFRHGGRVVVRATRTIRAGTFRLALPGHFPSGRYQISLSGRSPTGLTGRTSHPGSVG